MTTITIKDNINLDKTKFENFSDLYNYVLHIWIKNKIKLDPKLMATSLNNKTNNTWKEYDNAVKEYEKWNYTVLWSYK